MEARVFDLAAAGRTNASIAATLAISIKTVESHLSSLYRKLSVRSRAELGAEHARRNPRELGVDLGGAGTETEGKP
ncbi:response regulator transcription factor [Agromyces soli]